MEQLSISHGGECRADFEWYVNRIVFNEDSGNSGKFRGCKLLSNVIGVY